MYFTHCGGIQGQIQWVDWVATPSPLPTLGLFKLEIKKANKTITEVILSQIVPISFYQVSHPPSKILDMAMALWCRGHTALDHWVPEGLLVQGLVSALRSVVSLIIILGLSGVKFGL